MAGFDGGGVHTSGVELSGRRKMQKVFKSSIEFTRKAGVGWSEFTLRF